MNRVLSTTIAVAATLAPACTVEKPPAESKAAPSKSGSNEKGGTEAATGSVTGGSDPAAAEGPKGDPPKFSLQQSDASSILLPPPETLFQAAAYLREQSGQSVRLDKYVADIEAGGAKGNQVALRAGRLVTSFFVLLQTKDIERCKAITEELITLSKKLEASGGVRTHGRDLIKALDKEDWKAAKAAVTRVYDTLVVDLERESKARKSLSFVALGSWVEGVHITARSLEDYYSQEVAALLHQKRFADYFSNVLGDVDGKSASTQQILRHLQELSSIMSEIPSDSVNKETITNLRMAVEKIRTAD